MTSHTVQPASLSVSAMNATGLALATIREALDTASKAGADRDETARAAATALVLEGWIPSRTEVDDRARWSKQPERGHDHDELHRRERAARVHEARIHDPHSTQGGS